MGNTTNSSANPQKETALLSAVDGAATFRELVGDAVEVERDPPPGCLGGLAARFKHYIMRRDVVARRHTTPRVVMTSEQVDAIRRADEQIASEIDFNNTALHQAKEQLRGLLIIHGPGRTEGELMADPMIRLVWANISRHEAEFNSLSAQHSKLRDELYAVRQHGTTNATVDAFSILSDINSKLKQSKPSDVRTLNHTMAKEAAHRAETTTLLSEPIAAGAVAASNPARDAFIAAATNPGATEGLRSFIAQYTANRSSSLPSGQPSMVPSTVTISVQGVATPPSRPGNQRQPPAQTGKGFRRDRQAVPLFSIGDVENQ